MAKNAPPPMNGYWSSGSEFRSRIFTVYTLGMRPCLVMRFTAISHCPPSRQWKIYYIPLIRVTNQSSIFFCIKCDEFTTYPTVLCLVNAKYNIYPWPGLPTRVQIIFCKKCDEFTTYPTLLCLVNAKYNIYPWPGLPTRFKLFFVKNVLYLSNAKYIPPRPELQTGVTNL